MPNLQNAGAMSFYLRTFISIFGKSLKVSSYKHLQNIVHKYADALEYAELINSQEKIIFVKVFTRFLHKNLKFGGKIDLQESFQKFHDNAGKQIIEHFKAVNYRKITKHLFNKFNLDLNQILSRHIDYNLVHLPFNKVAKSYIRENYNLKGKSLKKAVISLEKTKLSFFPSRLRDNIVSLVLKTKHGFLWKHKKIIIKRIFTGYRDKLIQQKKTNKIQFYQDLKKQFLKLQKLSNENLVLSRFKQNSTLTPKLIYLIGDFYKKGFSNYYFHDKQEFNEFFSRYLDYFTESHILKFEHKIQFQQLVDNMKCFDHHNFNFDKLYKKLQLKKIVDKPRGYVYKHNLRKILHPLLYKHTKHVKKLLAKFKLKSQNFFDRDKIKFEKRICKSMYNKSPNEYIFDARKKLLKKTMYKMMLHLTDSKKIYNKNQIKELRKKDIQNILSLNGDKHLIKMFFKSKAFNGTHQLTHIKQTIGALKEINKVQSKSLRKILFKYFLLSKNKKLGYNYYKKLIPKDIYSKSFTRDQLLKIYKYKYDIRTAHKMLEFIKKNPDPLSIIQLSQIKLPQMNSYIQKVKFANYFKAFMKKLYYQKVFRKIFGKKISQQIDMLKFYYSKKEKLKKVQKLMNNQILKLFTNESQYKQDLNQSVNTFKKIIFQDTFGSAKRQSFTDGLLDFYAEILKNKQNWKIKNEGDFGKIKILMDIPEQGFDEKDKPKDKPDDKPKLTPKDKYFIVCCMCADCNDQEEILENQNLQFLRQADQIINLNPSFKINLFLQKNGKMIKQPLIEQQIHQDIYDNKEAIEKAEDKLNEDDIEKKAIEKNISENQAKQELIEENIEKILNQQTLEKDIQKAQKNDKVKLDNTINIDNNQIINNLGDQNYTEIDKEVIQNLEKNDEQKKPLINIQSLQSLDNFIPDKLDYTQPDNHLQNQIKNLPHNKQDEFKQNVFNIDLDIEPSSNLNKEILNQAKQQKVKNDINSSNYQIDNIDTDSNQIDDKQLTNQYQQLDYSIKQLKNLSTQNNKDQNISLDNLIKQQSKNVQNKIYIPNTSQNIDEEDLDEIYKPVTLKIIKKNLI